jgi:hypothetical protein
MFGLRPPPVAILHQIVNPLPQQYVSSLQPSCIGSMSIAATHCHWRVNMKQFGRFDAPLSGLLLSRKRREAVSPSRQ